MFSRRLLVLTLALSAGSLCGCTKGPRGEPGKRIIMLRYQVGSASTEQREKGFLDVIGEETDLFFLSSDQYGGATTESSYTKTQNLINRYKTVIDGLYCPNESTTFGALQALQESGLAGKIKFVGFDSSPKLIEAMKSGVIQGLVLQDPLRMGQLAVETLARKIRGEKVEKRVDTGVYLVKPENMEEKRTQELLSPPYEEWLVRESELPTGGEGVLTIAVIPKGTTHGFWKTIHAGAIKGALNAKKVHIIWKGPLKEDDREEQIKVVENFIARKVDGIVVAPLDNKALVTPISKAMASGIPVVIFDSALDGGDYVSFVATDNYKGGRLAGRRLAEIMGTGKPAASGAPPSPAAPAAPGSR